MKAWELPTISPMPVCSCRESPEVAYFILQCQQLLRHGIRAVVTSLFVRILPLLDRLADDAAVFIPFGVTLYFPVGDEASHDLAGVA